MRITDEQLQILSSLRCERLSSAPSNFRMVDEFSNWRNESIVDTLKNEAYKEDEDGIVAYYVVKHPNGQMLFFFSLKCGMLYDQQFDGKTLQLFNQLFSYLNTMSEDEELTDDEKRVVNEVKEKLRAHKGLTKQDIDRIPKKNISIIEDLEAELNQNMTHVGKTYSGIELVHFCANTSTDELWNSLSLPHPRGAVVFWNFVVPAILETVRWVGCQYLFLFAADLSDDQTLVEYYKNQLSFVDSIERATVKPLYDLGCKFMYQPVTTLSSQRDEFFSHFNVEAAAEEEV